MSFAALLIPPIPHSGSVSLASRLLREASCPTALHNMHYTCTVCVCVCACVCVRQAGKNKKVTRIEWDAAMPNLITCQVCLQCFFSLQWIHHTSVLRYFCLNVMFSYFLHTSPLKCIKASVSRSSRCQTQCVSSLQFKYINYFKVCRVSDATL